MNYEFAERLIELRRQHDLSQEDLAKQLGVSRQAISKWERAESTPDVTNLVAIAGLYNISLDELVHGEGPAVKDTADATEAMEPDQAAASTTDPELSSAEPSTEERATEACATTNPIPPPPPEGATPVQPAGAPASSVSQTPPPPTGDPVQPQAQPQPQPQSPQAQSTVPKQRNPLYTFPYPVLVVVFYLFLGFCLHLWHPGWVIFFTIPFYYWIASVISHDPEYIARHGGQQR